jgi:hypothetical protein
MLSWIEAVKWSHDAGVPVDLEIMNAQAGGQFLNLVSLFNTDRVGASAGGTCVAAWLQWAAWFSLNHASGGRW